MLKKSAEKGNHPAGLPLRANSGCGIIWEAAFLLANVSQYLLEEKKAKRFLWPSSPREVHPPRRNSAV